VILLTGSSPPGLAAFAANRFQPTVISPRFDCVVPEHSSEHRLTTTTQGPGLANNPLGMRSGRIIREAADLSLLVIQQLAETFLWCMAINKWAVLAWHDDTLNNSLGWGMRWHHFFSECAIRKTN